MSKQNVLCEIKNLSICYHTRLGLVSAVDNVSFNIHRGEILGLVGESGCGKSTMGKAILGMTTLPAEVCDGEILFDGEDILKYNDKQLRDYRGRKVSMIFQDPMTSLNPVQRIDEHLIEAIQVHEPGTKKEETLPRVKALVEKLGIRENRLTDYPHQLSGGMRQRVMVGLGLVLNANLIIADEATTSLDVIVEAKLVDQLRSIRDEYNISILAVTHNIALVAQLADRLAVMYAGHMVEIGEIGRIFDHPLHPYTQGLLSSVPNIKIEDTRELYKMPGEPPNLTHPPVGCRFHPRCPKAMPICSKIKPDLIEVAEGWQVQCWLYQDHPEKTSPTLKVSL